MKKGIVLMIVFSVVGAANAANLIHNGSFESGLSDWYTGGATISTDNGPSDFGSQSAQLYFTAGTGDIRSKCYEGWFNPGDTIQITFDYQTIGIPGTTTNGTWSTTNHASSSGSSKSGSVWREMIRFYASAPTGDGSVISSGSQYWNGVETVSVPTAAGTVKLFFPYDSSKDSMWQTTTVTLIVPTGAHTLNFNVATAPSDGSYLGTLRIDNVQLEVIPEPATIALLGLGLPMLLRRKKSA